MRLKALLPVWLPWAHKRFALLPTTERELLAISSRQMDRRLKDCKSRLSKRLYGRTKPATGRSDAYPDGTCISWMCRAYRTHQADHLPGGLIYISLIVILWPAVLQRFGLLAMMATCNVRILWNLPITSDLSSWSSGGSIFALAVAAALALCGFRIALGDRPLFTRVDLQP